MRRLVTFAVILLASAYAAAALLVWAQQDRFVFPGSGWPARPIDAPGVRVLELQRSDGSPFRAAWYSPEAPRACLLFFVGNGEDLASGARHAVELAAHGVAVLVPEYPGYGRSPGTPSVVSLLTTAEAACAHAERSARDLGVPLVVGGSSLGTFCAVHLAAQGRAARLLLRAPPTTLAEVAGRQFWWLPVGRLLRHRFDNLGPAAAVRCPVLIVHGEADGLVPIEFGRRLAAAFPGPAEVIAVPGAGHNDLSLAPGEPGGARIGTFLRGP
ncbi:MAG: alpha/beta hydrolase [Planctomycetes bacterium]|nr:alpha/beta hydrolase [Planctomycetota bacterium]